MDAPDALDLPELLRVRFGHTEFRPFQETVCRVVAGGRDSLLVMPTGAGKSLCYQLPGLARGGTTLVVSPLIALMEDQVAKLRERGLRAARIHSGRDRAESRAACLDYLGGQLDFLFIAPERLRVPGFPEMLARRKPALIAIDEAHCISQWGHDFRPDYRLLGDRLPLLRPSPIIALTATATPRVQRDIVQQLDMAGARLFIHGFRRENIAIEVVEVPPAARPGAVVRLLAPAERRPAIIYSPTRKQTESLAAELSLRFPTGAYHAGLIAARRDEVQSGFLAGQLEVIVATIAFGMGVDKPDVRTVVHTAIPASLEGYYQEIGRAGRDGSPARAILLHSYADRRTLEFLLDQSYPPPGMLLMMFRQLEQGPMSRQELARASGVPSEEFEALLDRLRVHGGARVEGLTVHRGSDRWIKAYEAQREHRLRQLDEIQRFTRANTCRMLQLVQHFGDQEDRGGSCGLCDVCVPAQAVGLAFRSADDRETLVMREMLTQLRRSDGPTAGQLHEVVLDGELPRSGFERLLGGLVRGGYVHEQAQSFEKNGRRIDYKRLFLTAKGREATSLDDAWVQVEIRGTKRRRSRRAPASFPKER